MIEADNLVKEFSDPKRGKLRGVDGVTFAARPGEILGLLGPNGAGKTTTLRMLATILSPTSGTARIAGYDVRTHPREVRRNLGFLSGDMGLYARLSPRETLRYFGDLNGLRRADADRRADELFARFEMEKFADARVDKFSTGMKQKTSIARAVLHDPPVLILDEPTNGLDVPAATAVERFILDEKRAGKCIIVSTHVMEEAEYLSDRIVVIHDGRVRADGTMEELRARTGKSRLREVFLAILDGTTAAKEATR